jgi:hypothetical protein
MTKLCIGITKLCEFRRDLTGRILKIERTASMIYRILIDEVDFGLAILLGLVPGVRHALSVRWSLIPKLAPFSRAFLGTLGC